MQEDRTVPTIGTRTSIGKLYFFRRCEKCNDEAASNCLIIVYALAAP